jgi:hypothetical protein
MVFVPGHDGSVIKPVSAEYRNNEAESLAAFLNKNQMPSRIVALKCSRGKWDSDQIGRDNGAEIIRAIFSPERRKCDCFIKYNKYADQNAPKESEERKRIAREMRITWALSVIAIIIAFASLLVAIFKP